MSQFDEKITDFTFLKDIGEGHFGKVKLAVSKKTGDNFAIKIMIKEKIESRIAKKFISEMEISKKFNHKNVIRVYSVLEDETNYYIIMEYCSKGELFDYIVSKKKLSKDIASIFFYQLINGIEYIHSKGYAHRDLKPENLLLTSKNILKIIDFGLAHEYNDNMLLSTKCGSPSYAAPEILKGCKYNGFKSDVWCCGIILYAMLTGFLPFGGENNKILFKNIIKCELKLSMFDDEEIKNLIKGILTPEPETRITINKIKESGFYLKGEKLFHKMEINNQISNKYNISVSSDKKNFRTLRNIHINIENSNSKNQNNDFIQTKINLEKKSYDSRTIQTKNGEDLLRHTKINPFLKIFKKTKNNNLYKINDNIKILLKKNNKKEDKIENEKNYIMPNIKIVNKDINNNKFDSEEDNKTEENRYKTLEKNNNNIKYQNFYTNNTLKSKLNKINNSIKTIKSQTKINERFNNKFINTETFNFRSQEKNNKFNDKKSYNLYKLKINKDNLTKSFGFKNIKNLLSSNSKIYKNRVINHHDKESTNKFLPILNNYKSKKTE